MLPDHKFGEIFHRIFIEANGIKLEVIELEWSISKTVSDGLTIKEIQPSCDAKMLKILLINH